MKLFDITTVKAYRQNPLQRLQSYCWVYEYMHSEKSSETYKRCFKELEQAEIDHAEWVIECDLIKKGEYILPSVKVLLT